MINCLWKLKPDKTDNYGEINLKRLGNFTTNNEWVNPFAFNKFISFRSQILRLLWKQKALKLDRLPRLTNSSNFQVNLWLHDFFCEQTRVQMRTCKRRLRKKIHPFSTRTGRINSGWRKLLFTHIIFATYFKLNQSFLHGLHVKYHLKELLNGRGQQRFTSGCNGRFQFLIILAIVDL